MKSRVIVAMTTIWMSVLSAGMALGEVTTRPTTMTATRPARHVVVIPPGFKLIEQGGYRVLCEKEDEGWARQAMNSMKPVTRPTTTPADLLEKLRAVRAKIAGQIVTDLALENGAEVEKFLKEKMEPMLERLDRIEPPVFYLVTTRERLKSLLKEEKWSDPRFYYNRLADDVAFSMGVELSIDLPMNDMVLPALYEPNAATATRMAAVTQTIRNTETDMREVIAGRGMYQVEMGFVEFIAARAIEPLKLPRDQRWLGLGIVGVLSAKYTSQVTGMSRGELFFLLTAEDRRNPMKAARIDLLHPMDLNDLRRQYVPLYVDAYRRRSVLVADAWIKEGGEGVIPKTLTALHKNPCADGPSLVKFIQQTTGVDLGKQMAVK